MGNLSSKYQLYPKFVPLTKITPELSCTR